MKNIEQLSNKETEGQISSAEILILLSFILFAGAIFFCAYVFTENEISVRIVRMTTDNLKKFIQDKENAENMRVTAFCEIKNRLNVPELNSFAYENLQKENSLESKICSELINWLNDNPDLKTAQNLAEDYITGTLNDKLWVKFKDKWARVSINCALERSWGLFTALNDEDLRRFRYVVNVLTITGNDYVFSIFEKYLKINDLKNKNDYADVVLEGLLSLKGRGTAGIWKFIADLMLKDFAPEVQFADYQAKLFAVVNQVVLNNTQKKEFLGMLKNVTAKRWADFIKRFENLKFN